MVFVYVDAGGHLRVSIHLDTAHPAMVEHHGTRGTVPLRIDVQDSVAYFEPAERSETRAWAVRSKSGELELCADEERYAALRAQRPGSVLLHRTARERTWQDFEGQEYRDVAAAGGIDLAGLADHPDLGAALGDASEHTLIDLRRAIGDELSQRSRWVLDEGLREALGWMYGGADPGGLRVTAVELTTAEYDDGHWWYSEAATVVFSDGSRITEDFSEYLDEALTMLASTGQPQAGDVLTLPVPA
jgi:hypothetical protein